MKYLKQFETHAEYEAAESSLILPNVSICKDTPNEVHYNPYFDPYAGHEYVEIGGLKWATMNIGASQPSDYGLYFAWGDTQGYTADQVGSGEGQKYFGEHDYKYYDSENEVMTKYNDEDGLTILQPSDDAVTAAWGGNWRMPTNEEVQVLKTSTTSAWTADYEGSGVAGLVLTSNDDSSKNLFFPAVSYVDSGYVINFGNNGCYWSSTKYDTFDAYDLSFGDDWIADNDYYRYYGFSVRGVLDE